MIHFTSDTHWGHKNIIQYAGRPFKSVDDMNEGLIENWNQQVQPGDTVYHLGDFSFMTYDSIKAVLRRLNGTKHLILGNHDKEMLRHRYELLSPPGLFTSIQSYHEFNHEGNFLVLFHYGQRVWNKSHHGSFHLYGHSHGTLPPLGRSVDVGVDCKEITDEYRPISYSEIVKYMSKREFVAVDRHGAAED